MVPYLLIFAGIFIYWRSFGWNVTTELSWGIFWSAFFIITGLVIMLKSFSHRY